MSTVIPILSDSETPVASALRTRREEFGNALTHGIGAAFAIGFGGYLVVEAIVESDAWSVVGCLFYVIALVGVLASSTLSHLYLPEHLNKRFRAYDQGFIYLLAVGSLSPFALVYLRTPLWVAFYLFCIAVAVAGFLSKVKFSHRVGKISLPLYIVQGWSQGIALIPLAKILPTEAFYWLMGGAACYCIGVVFLFLDNRRWKFHAIWHLWVLGACVCHYYAILQFVVRRS